jgi:hypothetical protein
MKTFDLRHARRSRSSQSQIRWLGTVGRQRGGEPTTRCPGEAPSYQDGDIITSYLAARVIRKYDNRNNMAVQRPARAAGRVAEIPA